MLLSKETANKIINEIEKVIDYDINIMDEYGSIIASTNRTRINTYHDGAYLIIKEKLQELKVNYDGEFTGCLKGINLPIMFENKIIGVIGITGEINEVFNYGKIIKKMTEILIEDLVKKKQQKLNEQSKLVFINDWVSGAFENNHLFFEQNAKKYDIDLNSQFTAALFKIIPQSTDIPLDFNTFDTIVTFISERLTDKQILFVCQSNNNIIISKKFHAMKLYDILNSLSDKISSQFPAALICGIGHTYEDYRDIPKSYNEALKIMNYFSNGLAPGTYLYDDNILPLMISEIPTIYKNQCFQQIFKNCSTKEIDDFSDFIITYYNCNGSINIIANNLYIHKNTAQYKINKIFQKTGLDLRNHKDMITLFLAANFKSVISFC